MSTTPASTAAPRLRPTGWWKSLPLLWKIGSLSVVFVVVLLGLQVFNHVSIRSLQFDTRLVDVAARQRVLNERYVAQVLATAAGKTEDHQATRARFLETANALTTGGETILNIDTGERGTIPPAPNDEIVQQCAEQKRRMELMATTGQALLSSAPGNAAARARRLEELLDQSRELAVLTNATTKALGNAAVEKINRTLRWQEVVTAAAAAFGILASIIIARQITSPLTQVMARAREIGDGDLRGQPLSATTDDELARLADTFNAMLVGLREVAQQSRAAAESLSAAAAEILASAQEQAATSGEQAAAVQQTTTTMEEISRSGTQIAEKARQVSTSAEATSAASNAGLQAVQEASTSMNTIQEHSESVARNVVKLSERTQAIGDIIVTVNEIAEQSHLLALNAAIEAAGAGEHGRRFSVVADEMKHLAEQSRDATFQVRSILGDIQREIHTSVMLTEEAVKRIELGKHQSDTAEATIRRMAASILESANAFQQIVAAANQQQIGFEQVTQAAQQIRTAVDQGTVGTRQLEAAAMDVNALSRQLRAAIDRYRL